MEGEYLNIGNNCENTGKGNSDSRNVVGLLVRDEGISGSDPPGYVTAPPPNRSLCSATLAQIQRKQAIHCSRARSY